MNIHQKKAKYCLKIQNVKPINSYKCNTCNKKFTVLFNYKRHIEKCISMEQFHNMKDELDTVIKDRDKLQFIVSENEEKFKDKISQYETTITEQKETIEKLQDKLENIAIRAVSRPTTTNNTKQVNNYIQQLQPVTDEYLISQVPNLTIEHIRRGAEGYAEYAIEYALKDRVICVDYARRKVKFKDREGNVITDPEMTNLATKFFNSIKDKNKELIIECSNKLKENFGDEVDTIVQIFDYKSAVDRGSTGEKTEFHHDFVKELCSQTLK